MAFIKSRGVDLTASFSAAGVGATRRPSHALPVVGMSLDQPGRVRVEHMLTFLSISHATLYARIAAGSVPPPDGKDGKRPYWLTETVRAILAS